MNSIGERIKSLRLGKGLSAQALGNIIGRSKSNISGYETGKYDPSASTVISLCEYFGVAADWLLTGLNVQKPEQAEHLPPRSRFDVYCDGVPLTEEEADLVAMYRLLDAPDRKTVFDIAKLKYQQKTGEEISIYSTYFDENEMQKSAPDDDDNTASGTA